ncbi:MAG: hypothetical protein ACLFQK_10815, partial [Fibrobacterota bacterium]
MNKTVKTSITVENSKRLYQTAKFLLENINDNETSKCPNRMAYSGGLVFSTEKNLFLSGTP